MPIQKKKCKHCAKKELFLFECSHCHKCFCMKHKMPEYHDCIVNFNEKKDNLCMEKLTPCKVAKI